MATSQSRADGQAEKNGHETSLERIERIAARLPEISGARTIAGLVDSARSLLETELGAPASVTLRSDSTDSRESAVLAFAGIDTSVGSVDSGSLPLVSLVPVEGTGRGDATLTALMSGMSASANPGARAVLEMVTTHAATCASLLLARDSIQLASREAEALYRAATLLVDARDLDGLVENILDAIDEHFGHPVCSIFLLKDGVLEMVGFRGHDLPEGFRRLPLDGPGVSVRAVRQGSVANVPDVRLDEDYLGAITATRSELAVPLRAGAVTIGVINLESASDKAFTRRDERLLSSFADQAARAIQGAQLQEQVRRKAQREELINDIVAAVNQTRDLDRIFDVFCAGLSRATGAERTYIATIDWQERVARFVHSYTTDDGPTFTGSFPLGSMPELSDKLWHGEVVAVADVSEDPLVAAARFSYERFGTAAVMYVPVVRSGDWAAVLTLCANTPHLWTEDEISIARTVGEQVGTAILQAELFNEINTARRQWETTFDTMSDGVVVIGDASKVTRANAAATSILMIARPDLLELTCCEVLATVSGEACAVHEALWQGGRVVIQPPGRSTRSIMITVDPVAEGGGAVVVLRDLSELQQAEAEARRQHVIVEQLTRSSADLIAMLDPRGRALWFNHAFAGASGLTEAIGGSEETLIGARVSTGTRELFKSELARALAGEPRFFETSLVAAMGGETHAMVSLTPVFDDQIVTGVLFVGRDVTALRRASDRAAEADKLRALGQLSSGVAHNFNNALAVILGRAQLLKRRVGEESPLVRDLEVIERVSHEAASTVRRIQNFARKRRRETFAPVDLSALLADTLDITSIRWRADSLARGVKHEVVLEVEEDDFTVLGDAAELREVFLNVIFNALDAMPNGGLLRVSLRSRGGFVEARLSDTGHGMSEEAQRRVFEPFFTTKDASGTGLGLSVSYGIISRHDGRIEFESELGVGTTFIITLPCSHLGDSPASLLRDVIPSLDEGDARVLVVDDDASVRELVLEALTDRGYDVREAASGTEALAIIAEEVIDVVVTDYAMPEMTGSALAAHIRQGWPSTKIVLVTGADIESLRATSEPDLILQKPFTLADLCGAVGALATSEDPNA